MKKPSQLQQGTNLADQLDSYSASVRANHAARSWSKRIRRWTPYAAAVGSSLALTTATDADIIYSGTHTSFTVFHGTQGGPITVGPGVGVFNLTIRHTSMFLGRTSGSARVIHLNTGHLGGLITNGTAYHGLKRLASGAKISAGAGNFQGLPGPLRYERLQFPSRNHGTWPANQTGFAGIEFGTAGGKTDFGWIRLSWNGGGAGGPVRIVDDFAYDNTGSPILAGSVPEPSTLLLTMLAAGSAGVMAWRKRRQAAKDALANATA